MQNKARKLVWVTALFFFFLVTFAPRAAAQKSAGLLWQELKSEHFMIYFASNEKFAKEILNKAEAYYRRIASDLGYPRYSDFWTWDKRVKIYIYPGQNSFLKATGQPNWSQGMADYTNKKIISYEFSRDFMDGLLPHELAHLIFRDFVGFKGEVPLWLDEGVAQWEELLKRQGIKEMAWQLYKRGALIPLADMMKLDIRRMKADEEITIRQTSEDDKQGKALVLSGGDLVGTYYIQAVTLVGFLIETYGSLSFAGFCRELRDGKALEEALKMAYGVRVQNLDELQANWKKYLRSLYRQ
ncbi:MAG: hypothetical protein NT066_01535 [Candidatus Omnitrophica bacterium]|nr:hypothetical protein [Candidatus Omnitrophota bacterium]